MCLFHACSEFPSQDRNPYCEQIQMGFALTHVRYTVGNGGSPDHAFYRVTTNRSCFRFDMTNSSKNHSETAWQMCLPVWRPCRCKRQQWNQSSRGRWPGLRVDDDVLIRLDVYWKEMMLCVHSWLKYHVPEVGLDHIGLLVGGSLLLLLPQLLDQGHGLPEDRNWQWRQVIF